MNLIGKMIDNRYEILEMIGNGGMATVYKAKCHVLNRYVAIKILKDEFTTDTEFIKRFNTEAQSAASMTHPNIVSIYDVGSEGSLYYIVMELIKGKTLKEIIQEEGMLPYKWSINIAIQIASALETAHKNNIIHRDIKPHNIIITEDGIAKVTDFGIAKAVSNSTMTAFGTTIGSVHYFSPEHAKGGYTDAKSDLYSLGVVMYEMLTGRVPFDADTSVSVALKQIQEEPVEPIEYNDKIPESVNKIILKAMQKDPNCRYQNATEMLEDLNKAIKNPNDDFVKINKYTVDSPTQRIPLFYDKEEKETAKNAKNKKPNKVVEFFKKYKAARVIGIIMLLGLVFFGVMFGTIALLSKRPSQIEIPNLVQTTEGTALKKEEAIALLESLGFTDYEIEEKYSSKVEKGYVISQEPKYQENFTVNASEKFKLVVSKGTQDEELQEKLASTTVTLPKKMKGKKLEDLLKEFEKLTEEFNDDDLVISYETTEEFNEELEAGYVSLVNPEEGTDITLDTVVQIVVSKGSQYKDITMQNVTGKSEAEARVVLEADGLVVNVEYEENENKSDGIVTKQSVNAGETIKEGTTVKITVNKQPVQSTATFVINPQNYITYKDEEKIDNETNTVTTSKVAQPVSIKIKVAGEEKYTKTITTTDTWTFTSTGTKEYEIFVNNNSVKQGRIDFSAGNQTVNVP